MAIETLIINRLKSHTVGENGVTKIRNNSIESEQNTIIVFEVFVEGKIKHTYINGVFEVINES